MKNIFSRITANIKKHKIISAILLVIIFIAAYFIYTASTGTASATEYVFNKVQTGNLVVSVSGSGQAATLSQVNITPQTTGQTENLGQIVQVDVKNGDFVNAGQVIAILDGNAALQTLNQAQASVESAQASYDKLVDGATASELASYNNSITGDQTSIANAEQNIIIQLQSAYSSVSNSVYLDTDPFFTNPTLTDRSFEIPSVTFSNTQLVNDVNNGRGQIADILSDWQNQLASSTSMSTSSDYISALTTAINNLETIRTYFDNMTTLFAVDATSPSTSGQSAIDTDKGTASSARSSADSSISTLTSALQSYNNDLTNLIQDEQSLAFETAPANPDDVTVSKSQLDDAEASLANAQQAYDSRIITAPFAGQIGGLNAQIGQEVSSSDSLGTIITAQKVVNLSLNEVDAAKVTAGDPVTLTFAALPNLTLTGSVSYLDPLGVVSQGVVNYSVQVAIQDQNDQVKTGMTATAVITTQTATDTLMIPTSAITTVGSKEYVLVENNTGSSTAAHMASSTFAGRNMASSSYAISSSTRRRIGSSTGQYTGGAAGGTTVDASSVSVSQVLITTGLSNDTETQVLSGLTPGESIVVRTITGASTTKTAAAAATTRTIGGGGGAGAYGGGARAGGFGGAAVGGL